MIFKATRVFINGKLYYKQPTCFNKKKAYLCKSVFQNTFENEAEVTFASRKADCLGGPGVNGRIILRCIFRKCMAYGLDRAGLG